MSQLLSSLSTAEKEAPQAALGNLRSHPRRRLSSGAPVLASAAWDVWPYEGSPNN